MKQLSPQTGKSRMIKVTGFITWSVTMVLLGTMVPELEFSQAQASSKKQIVNLDQERLAGKKLGEFKPYEPELGNLVARGHEYYYSEDGNFGIGVWESKPGEMTYTDLEYDELMYVLDGGLIMTDEDGIEHSYGPGEGLVLPRGWTGTLAVPEAGVRKIWVAYMGGKKG